MGIKCNSMSVCQNPSAYMYKKVVVCKKPRIQTITDTCMDFIFLKGKNIYIRSMLERGDRWRGMEYNG